MCHCLLQGREPLGKMAFSHWARLGSSPHTTVAHWLYLNYVVIHFY